MTEPAATITTTTGANALYWPSAIETSRTEFGLRHSTQLDKLALALCRAQGQILHAVKDSSNPFFKSKYADLGSVWDAIRAPFQAQGLAVAQFPSALPNGTPALETMLLHTSGQWMGGCVPLNPVKNDPQGLGAAVTYMRRYSLQSVAGVCAEDDDGETAMGRGKPTKATKVDSKGEPQTKKAVYSDDQRVEAGRLRAECTAYRGGDERFGALWKRMQYDAPTDFIDAASALLRDLQEENHGNA